MSTVKTGIHGAHLKEHYTQVNGLDNFKPVKYGLDKYMHFTTNARINVFIASRSTEMFTFV